MRDKLIRVDDETNTLLDTFRFLQPEGKITKAAMAAKAINEGLRHLAKTQGLEQILPQREAEGDMQ